jgi:hypothetical protein
MAGAEERELGLFVEPRYGHLTVGGQGSSGGGGTLQGTYGLTDSLALQLTGGALAHPLAAEAGVAEMGRTAVFWNVSAGVVYALDIVRIVPYFEAALGLAGLSGAGAEPGTELHLLFSLGVGGDYLINRTWSVGGGLRYGTFLTDPGRAPFYLMVGPRIGARFSL